MAGAGGHRRAAVEGEVRVGGGEGLDEYAEAGASVLVGGTVEGHPDGRAGVELHVTYRDRRVQLTDWLDEQFVLRFTGGG